MRKEQAITEMKLGLLEKGGMFRRDERISTVCLRDSRMDMQCNLADDLAAVKNYLELISWEVDLVGVDVVGGHHLKVCVKYVIFCTMQQFPTNCISLVYAFPTCMPRN